MAIKKLDFLELKWKENYYTVGVPSSDRMYPNLGFGYVRTLAHGTPSVQHLPYLAILYGLINPACFALRDVEHSRCPYNVLSNLRISNGQATTGGPWG